MKPKILFAVFLGLSALYALSCRKETGIGHIAAQTTDNLQQRNATVLSICDQFAYPDSLFYPIDGSTHLIINTLSPLTGTFGSYPDGLKLNILTGEIDISRSETGLRYLVWFNATGSTDTCKKYITISGVNFMDSIYVLKNTAVLAEPIYNATPNKSIDGSSDTEFDDGHDDDDGDGFEDEPPAGQEVIPQGIALDKTTGKIDLGQSITNGALGIDPVPGSFKDFTLNYKVADASTKALNTISFRLYYFHRTSEIPASLKKEYRAKRKLILFNQLPASGLQSDTFSSYITASPFQKGVEVKCRPAYIIIVK